MRVLLIGADTPLGDALQRLAQRWGRHEVLPVTLATARWKNERQAKKAVQKAAAEALVDVRLPFRLGAGQLPQPQDLQVCQWLAKACERGGLAYVQVSADRVFSGKLSHPYREQEAPDASDPWGRALAEAETTVTAHCSRVVRLRSGPLFAAADDNPFTAILSALLTGRPLVLDDADWLYPVEAADAARVLAGMLDQLGAGADPRGTYHYCSPDRTTHYGFAEAVLAAASQYVDLSSAALTRLREEGHAVRSWCLDCRELRDTFAIKQLPWRGVISAAVRQYFERHPPVPHTRGDPPHVGTAVQ